MRHSLKVTDDDDGNDDDNECDVTQWCDDDHDEGDTVHQQPSMCHTVTQQRPIRLQTLAVLISPDQMTGGYWGRDWRQTLISLPILFSFHHQVTYRSPGPGLNKTSSRYGIKYLLEF